MGRNTGLIDLAREYVTAFTINGKINKRDAARKMFIDHPTKFTSIENARSYIRYATGSKGEKNREHNSRKDLFQELTHDTTPPKPQGETIKARILIFDIETAPPLAHVWQFWNQNIQPDQLITDWFILTWAAKWLGEEKVYSARLRGSEARNQDDKRIMKGIWAMLNEADIVITQNGEKFDIPKLNTRFLLNGMNPPLPYVSIDIYKHAKKTFSFSYNRQDYISKSLDTPRKKDVGGMQTWKDCYCGNEEALKKMEEYNCGDVVSLEQNYIKMRPWIKPHPNVNLHVLDFVERCPNCQSKELKQEGHYQTQQNKFETLRCGNCGAVTRRKKSVITVEERRFLTVSIAK